MHDFFEQTFTEKDLSTFADIEQVEFEECTFENIEFSELPFKSTRFLSCSFENCSFGDKPLASTTFREVKFNNCRLMGVSWASAQTLTHPGFYGCKLDYSSFQGLDLRKAVFQDCSAIDVDFSGANLNQANFSGTLLLNTSFNGSDLRKANLRGATQYMIDPQFTKLKGTKVDFPEAISFLTVLGLEVSS